MAQHMLSGHRRQLRLVRLCTVRVGQRAAASGNQSPSLSAAVNPPFARRSCAASAGFGRAPSGRPPQAPPAIACLLPDYFCNFPAANSGLAPILPRYPHGAAVIVARHPARGLSAGEASSLNRCRRTRRSWELNSRRSDLPSLRDFLREVFPIKRQVPKWLARRRNITACCRSSAIRHEISPASAMIVLSVLDLSAPLRIRGDIGKREPG